MDSSSFSFIITYSDESGMFQNVWNSIKDSLNVNFASIKLKENLTTMNTLSSLNIKMVTQSENSKFHLYTIKMNSVSDLKNGVKERIIANLNLKKSYLVILMEIENSESSIKQAIKNFEKIKNEMKIQDIKLLPINPNFTKLIEITNEFFNFLKILISSHFNASMLSHSKNVEELKNSKNENKENTYNYLQNKIKYISYLQAAEFWGEIQICLEEDLFYLFECLNPSDLSNKEKTFTEPFSFFDFSELSINQKLLEKNLTNLEYQQFLFYSLIRSSKILRDYKKLNNYIMTILNNIFSLKKYFTSKYHFLYWCILFTSKMITFMKSLKSNFYTNFDEEINLRGQLIIFYNMKKFIKNYANLTKCEIPNGKIFLKILESKIQSEGELNKEILNLIKSYDNSESMLRENENNYLNFLKEMEEKIDEKSRMILNSKLKLLEEYLCVLDSLEKIHSQLNQNKLMLKTQIDKLPLLVLSKKYSLVRTILVNTYNIFKNEKWDFIKEYLNFSLMIIINCLEKNEENAKVVLDFINMKFRNFKEENIERMNNSENEKISNEIISAYLKNCRISLIGKNNLNVDMSKILNVEVFQLNADEANSQSNLIHLNIEKLNQLKILLKIKNLSKLEFCFSSIVIVFQDEMHKGDVNYEYTHDDLKFLNEEKQINHEMFICFKNGKVEENNFQINSVYNLMAIKFVFNNTIEGIFNFPNKEKNLKLAIKSNDIETKSAISVNHTLVPFSEEKKQIYYNTIYSINIELKNLDKFNFSNKNFRIFVNQVKESFEIDKSNLKLINERFELKNCSTKSKDELKIYLKDKIKIHDNTIEFLTEELEFKDNLIILQFFFLIEDIHYPKSFNNAIEIISQITYTEDDVQLEKLSSIPYFFREITPINISHLFSIAHKFRLEKDEKILVQTNIHLNFDYPTIRMFLFDSDDVEFDTTQNFSLINLVKYNKETNEIYLNSRLQFDYIHDGNIFTYHIVEKDLKNTILEKTNIPYYITISIKSSDEKYSFDGIKLFGEYTLKVKIKKFLKDDVLIMTRLKEDEKWAVIGKSKIIERFEYAREINPVMIEKNIEFTIIPLQDGYLKLPEIEFRKFNMLDSKFHDIDNVNSYEFIPLDSSTVVDGNQKIIKVYSINSCSLRLNLI